MVRGNDKTYQLHRLGLRVRRWASWLRVRVRMLLVGKEMNGLRSVERETVEN